MTASSALSLPAALPDAPDAGRARARAGQGADFALLDEADEWAAFSRPVAAAAGESARLWESSVAFEGMYCAACAGTIEDALRAVPGVRDAQVSAASHRGRVVWDESATRPSAWMQAALAAGYRPVPAHDAAGSARRQAETRRMLWRLGVAGVCMMQVMMYAAPAYFTAPGEMDAQTQYLLRWAQWVLAMPVVLFSCGPFFKNAWLDLKLRRISMDLPVALAMLVAFGVSSLGTFEPAGPFGREVYFDSLTMFVFFLLTGRWLELRLRERTAGALEKLMHRLPQSVERWQAGEKGAPGAWQRVAARRLRAGDVLRVWPGEVFPADGQVLKGRTLVDEALLTGESTPLERGEGSQVVAGSHNLSAAVEVRVQQAGAGTRYAQIVALMEQAASSKPGVARLADKMARPFLLAVLLAAGAACAGWWPQDPARALMVAVSILVVTCPCALSLATPAALLASAGWMARRGVLVRRLQALEALAGVDTVVFDKTGTLTRDAFALRQLRASEDMGETQALALAAQMARGSLHPVARALAAQAEKAGLAVPQEPLPGWREVAGQGIEAGGFRLGSARFCGVAGDEAVRDEAAGALACHLSRVDDGGARWLATFVFDEDLRPDAAAAVAALHAAGARVALLSGDRPLAAQRLARQAGIEEAQGGLTPDDKLRAVRQWQQAGRRVAMVGDGLNDAPTLAAAHVSFAFGRAVPLAQAQADFVALGDRLSAIAGALAQARRTLRVVRQNLAWAAAYNAVGVPLAVAGLMPAWAAGLGMAASSLLVALNALRLSRD